jgi:hypothetical protein
MLLAVREPSVALRVFGIFCREDLARKRAGSGAGSNPLRADKEIRVGAICRSAAQTLNQLRVTYYVIPGIAVPRLDVVRLTHRCST